MYEDARLKPHFLDALLRRQITADVVRHVLEHPEQTEMVREGRVVAQSRISMGDPARLYLVRVFVDIDRTPPEVVTAYRTSKITRYWRQP